MSEFDWCKLFLDKDIQVVSVELHLSLHEFPVFNYAWFRNQVHHSLHTVQAERFDSMREAGNHAIDIVRWPFDFILFAVAVRFKIESRLSPTGKPARFSSLSFASSEVC